MNKKKHWFHSFLVLSVGMFFSNNSFSGGGTRGQLYNRRWGQQQGQRGQRGQWGRWKRRRGRGEGKRERGKG